MIYTLLRAAAGVGLRWYYADIEVTGDERLPRTGPALLAVNHPNALVDALLVGWMLPRRMRFTAKATLFTNPVAGWALRYLGVIPLRRQSDEAARGAAPSPTRNLEAFRAVIAALGDGAAVLIFPEGKSHDEPAIAPLRSGAARMALQARDGGVRGLRIVPIGLVFERKEAPRSRVLVQVGQPIDLDEWAGDHDASGVAALTATIDQRLRAVTLNYGSIDTALETGRLARLLARIMEEAAPTIARGRPPLATEAAVAARLEQLRAVLPHADPALRERADTLLARLNAFRSRLAAEGIRLEDLAIDRGIGAGATFVAREAWTIALAGPVAVWGTVNHWLPFRAARVIAMRHVPSAADPAMRTIVAGAVLVVVAYALQGVAVGLLLGWLPALLYVVSLPLAADVNFVFRERLRRALSRARTYLRFRRDPALQQALRTEADALRTDARALDAAMDGVPVQSVTQ